MSRMLDGRKVSTLLIVPWIPGMTEWVPGPSFFPSSYDEISMRERIIDALELLRWEEGGAPIHWELSQDKMMQLQAAIEVLFRWDEEQYGKLLTPKKRARLYRFIVNEASLFVDPGRLNYKGQRKLVVRDTSKS